LRDSEEERERGAEKTDFREILKQKSQIKVKKRKLSIQIRYECWKCLHKVGIKQKKTSK